jgi:cell division protein FtsB
MRHVLTDVAALNARLEALRAENEKLKGSPPAEKNPK